jgi:hypothetical protein
MATPKATSFAEFCPSGLEVRKGGCSRRHSARRRRAQPRAGQAEAPAALADRDLGRSQGGYADPTDIATYFEQATQLDGFSPNTDTKMPVSRVLSDAVAMGHLGCPDSGWC